MNNFGVQLIGAEVTIWNISLITMSLCDKHVDSYISSGNYKICRSHQDLEFWIKSNIAS